MTILIQLDTLFLYSTLVTYLLQIEKLLVLAIILYEICCLSIAWQFVRRHKILFRGRQEKKKFENTIRCIRTIVALLLR